MITEVEDTSYIDHSQCYLVVTALQAVRSECGEGWSVDMAHLVTLCANGELSQVIGCLQRGHDVNTMALDGSTGLMWAAFSGYTSVVQLLLTVENCQVNCQDSTGYTALHFACFTDNSVIVRSLLAHTDMSSENIRDSNGWTPVMCAVIHGNTECVRLLVSDSRVDLETRDNQGKGLEKRLKGAGKGLEKRARWGR